MAEAEHHARAGNWDESDRLADQAGALRAAHSHVRDDAGTQPTASQHLSKPQFSRLHGTNRDMRPGTLIRPSSQTGHQREYSGYGNEDYAFSTDDHNVAARYARDRKLARGGTERVYEVEPTGNEEPDPDETNGYRSRSPYRVIRRIPRKEWDR